MDHPLKICVVDDNPAITELLEDHFLFSTIECEAISFNDPQEAIHYLDAHPSTDVTITDFHMGKYNGLDVIEHTPDSGLTILISGHISDEEKCCLDSSKVIFFDKPLSMKQLDKAIQCHSKRSRVVQQS